MAKRITDQPVKQRFTVTEGGANSYAQADISLPLAVISGNRIQAIEILEVWSDLTAPDSEDGQANTMTAQLTRDSQAAIIQLDDVDLIWKRRVVNDSSAINASFIYESIKKDGLVPMGDRVGELVLERTIHIAVAGTGNAGAKTVRGYFTYHIVELSALEVAIQLFVDDI